MLKAAKFLGRRDAGRYARRLLFPVGVLRSNLVAGRPDGDRVVQSQSY